MSWSGPNQTPTARKTRPAHIAVHGLWDIGSRSASRHLERHLLDDGEILVSRPRELERAGARHLHEEGDERVRRRAGLKLRGEHVLTLVLGGERVDDVARDGLAGIVLALARLHDVADQRLHFDHVADLGAVGKLDAGFRRPLRTFE